MPFGCKTKAEKTWLMVSLTALVVHRLLEIEPSPRVMWLVEALMVVLTFPLGLIVMFFLALGVDASSRHADFSWLLDWSTLLVIGYLQWFWMLPEIRRNSQPITFNLTSPVEIAASVETAAPPETATPAPPPHDTLTLTELPPHAAPVVFNVAAFVPPLSEFDEAGLTALDRVLRAQQ
jgi:hypothetical protein